MMYGRLLLLLLQTMVVMVVVVQLAIVGSCTEGNANTLTQNTHISTLYHLQKFSTKMNRCDASGPPEVAAEDITHTLTQKVLMWMMAQMQMSPFQ